MLNQNKIAINNLPLFNELYDKHAAKAYGFILLHSDNRKEAEEYLESFFLKIWEEIKTISNDTEKNIVRILLLTCKPLYKSSTQNHKVNLKHLE